MKYRKTIIALCAVTLVACARPNHNISMEDPFPVKYENDLFSIRMPKGWEYDATNWKGLDSLNNDVELYSETAPVWFHIVKTFMPMKWKDINEATEMALAMRSLSEDNVVLINRIDSVDVGGYPSSILYFANYVDNDTIIQKQFVTYVNDSHIVIYFNENFYSNNWDYAQEYGDKIISTIKIKKVTNPLEKEGAVKNIIEKARPNIITDDMIENIKTNLNN